MHKVTTTIAKVIVIQVKDDDNCFGKNQGYKKIFQTPAHAAKHWAEIRLLKWERKKYWSAGATYTHQDDRYWKERDERKAKYYRRALPIFNAMLTQH